ncbi:hypothetical protein MY1884_004870 [Beauveria asiatica]
MERPDELVNLDRGRLPPGSTRYGEDDARDYTEFVRLLLLEMLPRELNEMRAEMRAEMRRAEHRLHVEINGRDFDPDLAGLGARLPRAHVGAIAEALQPLFDLAPLPPPFNSWAPPPMRHMIGRGWRRDRLPHWSDLGFSANIRANFSTRAEHRYRDDEDGYFDWENDSTTFYDPFDMPLGPRRRFY